MIYHVLIQHIHIHILQQHDSHVQHLTMYSIYMQLYLLLIGYCFVARRRSAISLSSTSTFCCFSSALLRKALAFVTDDNSPLFSHFSYISFEVERREETSVFNRLCLPSNSCIASVSFLFFFLFRSLPPVLPFVEPSNWHT